MKEIKQADLHVPTARISRRRDPLRLFGLIKDKRLKQRNRVETSGQQHDNVSDLRLEYRRYRTNTGNQTVRGTHLVDYPPLQDHRQTYKETRHRPE